MSSRFNNLSALLDPQGLPRYLLAHAGIRQSCVPELGDKAHFTGQIEADFFVTFWPITKVTALPEANNQYLSFIKSLISRNIR